MTNRTFGQVLVLLLLVAGGAVGTAYMLKRPTATVPDAVVKSMVADLGDFYRALADCVRRDRDVIKTTGQFRSAHVRAAKLLVSGTDYQQVAGRNQEISKTISDAIGLEDQKITPPIRTALANALDQVGDSL